MFIDNFLYYISAQQVVICIRLALQEGLIGEWARHFSGYVVTLLVIFYLQIEKKLPSVSSLQAGVKPVKCGGELYINTNENDTQNCDLFACMNRLAFCATFSTNYTSKSNMK